MFPSGWHWLWMTTAALIGVAVVWYTRHPTAREVLRGGFGLPADEVEALAALLAAAGRHPRRVRVVRVRAGDPCWSYRYRHWIDDRLGVFRQYGRHGHNVLGVAGGHLVGISLVGTDLTDMALLAAFPALDHIQLRESRIARVDGVRPDCRWTRLILQRNALTDAAALAGAPHLESLDVSFNRLDRLPPLDALPRLRDLDARLNRIASVQPMRGHPALERVELYGNPLASLEGMADLPRLEALDVSDTGLATLDGLGALPVLYRLGLASNHVRRVGGGVFEACPALAYVDLSGNPLEVLPGFERATDGRMRPVGGGALEVDVRRTPLAAGRAVPG